jgi:predicted dehydrogenase
MRGTVTDVETPTHISATLEFEQGAQAILVLSFDVWAHCLPIFEIYGEKGTLMVPDPNTFGGEPMAWREGGAGWESLPVAHAYGGNSRDIGVADMSRAIERNEVHGASGSLACHVLEAMEAILESAERQCSVNIRLRNGRPAPLKPGLAEGELE